MRHGAFELVDFTNATLNLDGSKECVNSTGIIEMYDKKPIHECTHKNEEQCHHTYVTQFEPIQEEECDVNYQKSCQVSYQKLYFFQIILCKSRCQILVTTFPFHLKKKLHYLLRFCFDLKS